MHRVGLRFFAAMFAAALLYPGAAKADLIFSGTGTDTADGAALSATVDFSLTGNLFQIVITNNNVAISQGSVLTNLGFNFVPAPATPLPSASGSAAVTAGSATVVATGGTLDTTPVGKEWAYLTGGGASSGFGVGTGNGNLCGTVGCGTVALDGAAFGLVGTGTDLGGSGFGNGKNNVNANTYIENSITIDITLAAGSTFTLADITSVDFQYGTAPGEGDITVDGCTGGTDCKPGGGGGGGGGSDVPEPDTLLILGAGLVALALIRRYGRLA